MRTITTRVLGGLLVTLCVGSSALQAQSISLRPFPKTAFCGGDTIAVTFDVTGFWGHNNAFVLQLSDTSGGFVDGFQSLGSIKDTVPGTFVIKGPIPSDVLASAKYRFRILAAYPLVTANSPAVSIGSRSWPAVEPAISTTIAGADSIITTALGFASTVGKNKPFTLTWDFGPGANPPTATYPVDPSQLKMIYTNVTYATGGLKTVTLSINSPDDLNGCMEPLTWTLNILDCTSPSIPHSAVVISRDTSVHHAGNRTYWVNPGVTISDADRDTIFAEIGSTILGAHRSVIYMKTGSVRIDGWDNTVREADDVSSLSCSEAFTLHCSSLQFDYTNAPPNKIITGAVPENVATTPITLSPNPTTGSVAIRGLPLDDITISVMNLLGETVVEQKHVRSADCTLDLSKLASGAYYVRISSVNSVVTKAIIKQ